MKIHVISLPVCALYPQTDNHTASVRGDGVELASRVSQVRGVMLYDLQSSAVVV